MMPIKSLYSSCAFYFCAYLTSALTFYLYLYLWFAGRVSCGFGCATSKGEEEEVLPLLLLLCFGCAPPPKTMNRDLNSDGRTLLSVREHIRILVLFGYLSLSKFANECF